MGILRPSVILRLKFSLGNTVRFLQNLKTLSGFDRRCFKLQYYTLYWLTSPKFSTLRLLFDFLILPLCYRFSHLLLSLCIHSYFWVFSHQSLFLGFFPFGTGGYLSPLRSSQFTCTPSPSLPAPLPQLRPHFLGICCGWGSGDAKMRGTWALPPERPLRGFVLSSNTPI